MSGESRPSLAAVGGKKPRLAIVSTFDELCGIAGYTRFLIKQIEGHFDIEVFDLEQFFMRSNNRHVRKLADKMVKEFCARAKEFDFVNIQLEHGTLGGRRDDIWRRFAWLAKAAPALSVTFHTVLPQERFPFGLFFKTISNMNFAAAGDMIGGHRTNRMLTRRMFGLLRRLQTRKPVNVIVHTRRDMRSIRYVNQIESVYDHPLAFLSSDDVEKFRAEATRESFPMLGGVPKQAKLIGVFGFLNDYKGFETAIRALQRLPEWYHLVIFGGLHPNEIKPRQQINAYVKRLLDEAYVGKTIFDEAANATARANAAARTSVNGKKAAAWGRHETNSFSVSIDSTNAQLLFSHPRDVSNRMHFMGTQTDEDFARAMGVCDCAVFPYLEVGQSSSGPISIALEMGARVLAARTWAFMQLARYHPNAFEMFEIGNDVELAEKLSAPPSVVCGVQPRAYNAVTNAELYVKANSRTVAPLKARAQDALARPDSLRAAE